MAREAPSQVPRLTTMLRTYTTDRAGQFDVDTAYVARAAVLAARRQQPAHAASSAGSSSLARRLLPAWDLAPKPHREAFDAFLASVGALLGGELGGEELYASAETVYDTLSAAPTPNEMTRRTLTTLYQPVKEQLKEIFGFVQEPHFNAALAATRALQTVAAPAEEKAATTQRVRAKRDGTTALFEFGSHVPWVTLSDVSMADAPGMAEDAYASFDAATDQESSHTTGGGGGWGDGSDESRGAETGIVGVSGGGGGSGKDLRWLRDACDVAAQLQGGGFSGEELAEGVSSILLAGAPDEEAAAELMEWMGMEAFELISSILEHRALVTGALLAALDRVRSAAKKQSADGKTPSVMQQVSVRSEREVAAEKARRKDQKRLARRVASAGGGGDVESLHAVGFVALLQAEVEAAAEAEAAWADSLHPLPAGSGGFGGGDGPMLKSLPAGTKRTVTKTYEEVFIPATPTAAPKEGERLVPVEEMEEWAQTAFEGMSHLNRIQSRIYDAAFNTNDNLLVCAPTGAGKTNIAMLAVLHEVGQHLTYGVLNKEDFKVVYVAPMKALAAEMTSAFGRRLRTLGIAVRELTGDMQLSKRELEETQIVVTTPEKWDVLTRKGSEVSMAAAVRLLIIDEVHLLNDDRGPVIETLVARTLRQVETTQSMIRIVGLSATLPNYQDVARFLGVNEATGLFYFDAAYRPVPLTQHYVGVMETNIVKRNGIMNDVCFEKIAEAVRRGKQAMVFVHSRKETAKTARTLSDLAGKQQMSELFSPQQHPNWGTAQRDAKRSRNRELTELFEHGFGCHHAGMVRSDRNLAERLFADGVLKVLVCTATLAWGVNLPAQTVVIKGTQVYDAQKGGFKDLGMLDVMQIFGRAGRPQFKQDGEAYIITSHNKLSHYLGMLTHQIPIESQFVKFLPDNLNAELVLGSVSTVKEACTWLGYTYLHVRMMRNPLAYGLKWEDVERDPQLFAHRKKLVSEAARQLDHARTLRFDERSGNLYPTEQGRVASHFYVGHKSMEEYNQHLKRHMSEADVFHMVAHSAEFENIIVRDEEVPELQTLARKLCPVQVKGGVENKIGKVNVLLQAYISRARVDSFSLTADLSYISQSAGRIFRALFELCLRRGWCSMADTLLAYCIAVERRLWPHASPLRQFEHALTPEILMKLEAKNASLEMLLDMEASDIGAMMRHPAAGKPIKQAVDAFPRVTLEANIQPITRSVLRVRLTIEAAFYWKDSAHGNSLKWLIWVEDSNNEHIYHSEVFYLTKKACREGPQAVAFTIPIFEPLPAQYYVRCVSDGWLGAETTLTMSFKNLILPQRHPPHTELLDLDPLPLEALGKPDYISMYQGKFTHFNAIQTQAFHTLYHTDHNVLLGAPTGSGKTISSELAIMRAFTAYPDMKVIYIAPLKALVKERITDWRRGLCVKLKKRMVELTGDYTPDMRALQAADLIVATPEKWDGISRNWQNRAYVKKVSLLVIDEIHLLGADRGPILEVIVSRMRYITTQTGHNVRFVGLSTALANARDIGDWLGIDKVGLYNFRPSVRPVPLEVHIQGYPGKFYCPRMATMNKPTYAAITSHSPEKPVLVFVASRRQTRLTALDLITYAAADENPRQWLQMSEHELETYLARVRDPSLKHTLAFGIGMHHAGLCETDRTVVEELFVSQQIQILVCTSTLAWGVNFPAHLVVVKGTEFYDAPTRRYVDFPITDVLQMMGRAGRPQFDNHGVAVILVHEPKKSFYKKFLYEPFPVESSLPDCLHDHFNAEIVGGTLTSKQDAVDYLTWTYFFRRLVQNPTYYDLDSTDHDAINTFLSGLVENTLFALEDAQCIAINDDDTVEALTMGRIAAYYYLQYTTAALFSSNLQADMDLEQLTGVLCAAAEYDELPVRHNEDKLNAELANQVPWKVDVRTADDPHTKANLLLQCHFSRLPLPISDYVTDTRGVLDNSVRIVQALVDVLADAGWLACTLHIMNLMQMLMQSRWVNESSLLTLPHVTHESAAALARSGLHALPQLCSLGARNAGQAKQALTRAGLSGAHADDALKVAARLPLVSVKADVLSHTGGDGVRGGKVSFDDSSREHEAVIQVELTRQNRAPRDGGGGGKGSAPHAYAPRFPKMKEEGWWLVVGDCASGELYALKRVGFLANTSVKLKVPSSALDGELMLYCMSDCYLGLDQQIVLTSRPSHSAQQRPRRNRGKAPPPPPPPSMATETDLAETAACTSDGSDDEFWDMRGDAAVSAVGATERRGDEDFWDMSGAVAMHESDVCAVDETEAHSQLAAPAAPGAEGSSDDDDDQGFWLPSS